MNKKGLLPVIGVLVLIAVALSGTAYYFSMDKGSGDLITGAAIGSGNVAIETMVGPCNISIKSNIANIGHDYQCNTTNGFQIDADIDYFDCQGHTITCIGNCTNTVGILISGRTGVEIRNCKIYNFTDGIKLDTLSSGNIIYNNELQRNEDGIEINNATANNISNNIIVNNTVCGINATKYTNNLTVTTNYNIIWNNKLYNTTGNMACSDATFYNFWYMNRTCPDTAYNISGTYQSFGLNTTNIIGGPCLGGNYWNDYKLKGGTDNDGDGLGNTLLPYPNYLVAGVFGNNLRDNYPLIEQNGTCPAVWGTSVELTQNYTADSYGECFALIKSGITLDCKGYALTGNGEGQDHQRGIEIVGVDNVTVKNCLVQNFSYGVYVSNSNDTKLINLTVIDNNNTGIYVGTLSSYINISGNRIGNNRTSQQQYGIYFSNSKPLGGNSKILSNTINNNTLAGIYMGAGSDYNVISSNNIYWNKEGIIINDSDNGEIYNNVIRNNTFSGNIGKGVHIISSTIGDFGASAANSIYGNDYGVYVEDSHSTAYEGITGTFYNNIIGLYMTTSSDMNIQSFYTHDDSQKGIVINSSSNIGVSFVNINSTSRALDIYSSNNITVGEEVYLGGSTSGMYLSNINGSTFGEAGSILEINGSATGLSVLSSNNNTIRYMWIHGGSVGVVLSNASSNNTLRNLRINDTSIILINITSSVNNTIYNNYFDNSTSGQIAYDNGTNKWNTSRQLGANILGGTYLGGNYWSAYAGQDTDNDGLGNTAFSIPGGTNSDNLPLVSSNVTCGNISNSITLVSNISATGDCFNVLSNNVTINCNNYWIIGNGTGSGIKVSSHNLSNITACKLKNFTTAIALNNAYNATVFGNTLQSNTYGINLTTIFYLNFTGNTLDSNGYAFYANQFNQSTVTSNSILSSTSFGIILAAAYNNTFTTNTLKNNDCGLNASLSYNNTIYDNFFYNTLNARDNGNNKYNITYNCSSGSNIIGGSCKGGNFWSDYNGVDAGNGTYPYNTSNDGVGDTALPYTSVGRIIAGGDYLPLLPKCGNVDHSFILSQNMSSSGTCFTVTANNITIDCSGKSIIGTGTGAAISLEGKSGVTIANCSLFNFTYGIYLSSSNINNITLSYVNNNSYGIYLSSSNINTIYSNRIYSNTQQGIYLAASSNNSVYNNNFTNTNNAYADATSNSTWNTSYTATTNIIGGTYYGGNYWSDYTGTDSGLGTYPHNQSNDGIGDSQLPYDTGISINGDYLPLTSANGSITGACPITVTKDTKLSADVNCSTSGGNALVAGADNVTIDCNNQHLVGNGGSSGIYISGKSGVVIKNCNISSFYYGINVINSQNVNISTNNYLHDNDFYAIYLFSSNNTRIESNNLTDDNNGIYQISSIGTYVSGNDITLQKKFYGVYSFNSPNLTLSNNNLNDNYHGVYLVNSSFANLSSNNITQSDDYSLFMHKGTSNSAVASNNLSSGQDGIRIKEGSNSNTFTSNILFNHSSSGVYVTDSSANTFINLTATNNTNNFYLSSSATTAIYNSTITGSANGVTVDSSSGFKLNRSTVNSTTSPCVLLNLSSSATIDYSLLQNNARILSSNSFSLYNSNVTNTLELASSNSSVLSGNNVTGLFNFTASNSGSITGNAFINVSIASTNGTTFSSNTLQSLGASTFTYGTMSGITVQNVNLIAFNLSGFSNSQLSGNTIKNTTTGILLRGSSNTNTIFDNWFSNSAVGLNISSSSSNTIYNNYFSNTVNVADDTGNKWNTSYACGTPNIVGGPCKGGNFYSDYSGLDNGASGREQGDGIGDQPANYTINSAKSAFDKLPLVLYAARLYSHPDVITGSVANTMTAYGNNSGELSDGEVVPAYAQIINYTMSGKAYAEYTANFDQGNVDMSLLMLNYDSNKTAANKSGITSGTIALAYSLYVHHDNGFDNGIYVCPDTYNLSVTSTCSGRINVSVGNPAAGISITSIGTAYKVTNLTNSTVTVVISPGSQSCGATIVHDTTFSSSLSCNTSDAAINVGADNITLNLNGYSLIGNNSGIGINISGRQNVKVINANIKNFSTGISVDPSYYINISNCNISNNSVGIKFVQVNHSKIVSNKIYNNALGVNLSQSYNNTIYNNNFTNTNNAWENGTNYWNTTLTTSTNIIGGARIGGNYWSNYNGIDAGNGTYPYNTSGDGIGDTLVPYNNSANLSNNDYLPYALACTSNVTYGDWSSCASSVRSRNATTVSSCTGTTVTQQNESCDSSGSSSSSSSSSSSGGGGGGGSSSSSASAIPAAKITCTQSWECGSWSNCDNGKQTRSCTDQNDCNNKLSLSKVDEVVKVSSPATSKNCEVKVETQTLPAVEEVVPPAQESTPAAPEKDNTALNVTLSSLGAIAVFGGMYSYWRFAYNPGLMRRRLKKLSPMLATASSEVLKDDYKQIYQTYLKLSEKHKQNFYGKVTQVREQIEEQLKAEKRMEELLQKTSQGGFEERKKVYVELYNNYLKLPAKAQQKYYPSVVHLRDQLERGVKGI